MSTFIQEQHQAWVEPIVENPKKKKTKIKLKQILCSGICRKLAFLLFFVIFIPALVYFFMFDHGTFPETSIFSCLANEKFKVPCGKTNITAEDCQKFNCCFNLTSQVCYHYLPSMYYYEKQPNGTYTTSQKTSPFNSSTLQNVKISVYEKTEDVFSITLHEATEAVKNKTLPQKSYTVHLNDNPLSIQVNDRDNDTVFSTIFGPLIASEFYWEWTFLLTNETLFGLDRNVINLTGNNTLTRVIYKNKNDHVTLPVFWAYQNSKFYGVAIKHDGPLEITILPSNLIILKTIAGRKIELEMFLGPTPQELHKKMAGDQVAPPAWTLGTHICRRSSDTDLEKLLTDYESDTLSQFDTDCIHENIFFAISNTTQAENLTAFNGALDGILKRGAKFLLSVPPQILADNSSLLYNISKEQGILLQKNKTDYIGMYLKKKVVYPHYSHPSIAQYTEVLVNYISDKIGLNKISGLVLNDNWPEDDSYRVANGSDLPYFSKSINDSMAYTLPWDLLPPSDNSTFHMIHHNSYGTLQNSSLYQYFKNSKENQDMFIISATKNFGDLEPAIVENFNTSWENFRVYLQRTLFNSISGNHLVGLPVCGDTQYYNPDVQDSLCLRWYLAASTMPYFRVSSVKPFRDPESLGSKFVAKYASLAIERRKLLQEYYYTILTTGEPIVRPMYYDYFEDISTFYMTSQYTIGKNLIVAHPMSLYVAKIHVYLPKTVGIWYEFWGGLLYNTTAEKSQYVDVDVVETDWVSFIGQGSIISLTRNTELNLTIALNCSIAVCQASGDLFKDEHLIHFTADIEKVTISNIPENCGYILEHINLYYYEGLKMKRKSIQKSVGLCEEGSKDGTVIYFEETPESSTSDSTIEGD